MEYIYVAIVVFIFIGIYLFIKLKTKHQEKLSIKNTIRNISISSILMALAAILKMYGIMISDQMRISFYAVPLIIAGLVCGFEYGILASLGADLVYSMFSAFPFNIAYTISALFWGLLGGFLKTRQNLKWFVVLIWVFIVSLIETHINLLTNWILYGKGTTFILMLYKYLVLIIKLPITVFLVTLINNRVIKKLNLDKEK